MSFDLSTLLSGAVIGSVITGLINIYKHHKDREAHNISSVSKFSASIAALTQAFIERLHDTQLYSGSIEYINNRTGDSIYKNMIAAVEALPELAAIDNSIYIEAKDLKNNINGFDVKISLLIKDYLEKSSEELYKDMDEAIAQANIFQDEIENKTKKWMTKLTNTHWYVRSLRLHKKPPERVI